MLEIIAEDEFESASDVVGDSSHRSNAAGAHHGADVENVYPTNAQHVARSPQPFEKQPWNPFGSLEWLFGRESPPPQEARSTQPPRSPQRSPLLEQQQQPQQQQQPPPELLALQQRQQQQVQSRSPPGLRVEQVSSHELP